MIKNWRTIIIIILMTLSLIDLGATYYYVKKYKTWQPEKEYHLMEGNPLLVMLWDKLGFNIGMFVGSVIIFSLIYIVGKTAHPVVVLMLFLVLVYVMFNHYSNISLLKELIQKHSGGIN